MLIESYKYDEKSFVDRLKFILKGESVNSFAKRAGISESVVRRYLDGSLPGIDKTVLIARAANVSLEWLATGNGYPSKTYEKLWGEKSIPLMEVKASAGCGTLSQTNESFELVTLSSEWVRQQNLNTKNLFLLPAIGDSMEPTISSGDILLCSNEEHHLKKGDGIYVFRHEESILVKRLQVLPGKKIRVKSDNKDLYDLYDIENVDAENFKILGKVVFILCKRI